MDPTILASLFGAKQAQKAQNTNSLLGSATSIYNTHMTNKANRELAEYSYAKDLEQWYRETEYNTPLNQMKRYQEAGLNPNLIYSQGNPGNSGVSSPNYKAPNLSYQYQTPRISSLFQNLDILGAFQNYRVQDAQKNKIDAETNNIRTMNEQIVADTLLKRAQEAKANQEFNLAKRLENNAVEIQKAQLSNYQYDTKLKKIDYEMRSDEQRFFNSFDDTFGTEGTTPIMKHLFRTDPKAAVTMFAVLQGLNYAKKKDFKLPKFDLPKF